MFKLLQKIGMGFGAFYAAAYALKTARVKLKYFTPDEFGAWWPLIDDRLLYGLDAFREAIGVPIQISPVSGAIGRISASAKHSQHFAVNGVSAIDILIPDTVNLESAYDIARSLGIFTGIGAYPHWLPSHGLHLDVRDDKTIDDPALWSGLKIDGEQVYRSIDEAFA